MTDGVAEVQLAPLAPLLFVALDHARLVADAAGDDLGGRVGERAVLKERKQRLAAQHAGLDGLRRAVGKDGGGQGPQAVRIAQHGGGLQKRARKVFPRRKVDGRLAADGGIHGGEQRGRQLHIADAAQVRGRGKARHVAGHAAAERRHAVRARELGLGQKLQNGRERREILMRLPRREHIRADGKARVAQARANRFKIKRSHIAVGGDRDAAAAQHGFQPCAALPQQSRADGDLIGRRGMDFNGLNRGHSSSLPGRSSLIFQLPPAVAFFSRPSRSSARRCSASLLFSASAYSCKCPMRISSSSVR